MSQPIRTSVHNRIATVSLNRPEVRNALDEAAIAALTQAFAALGEDAQVRAIVLMAEGTAFCAGGDLNWVRRMADAPREQSLADTQRLAFMLRTVYECPKPTIARVQGNAYGVGLGLVAACDIAVAADTAGFCLPEVRLGLAPAVVTPYVLRALGTRATHRYALTGERFDAAEALRLGLLHTVAAPDRLDAQVNSLLQALLTVAPDAVRITKKIVQDMAGRDISRLLVEQTVELMADTRAGDEAHEGLQAFLQKRPPNWLPKPEMP